MCGAVYYVSEFTEDGSVLIGEGVGKRGRLVFDVFVRLLQCRSGFGIAVVYFVFLGMVSIVSCL